MIPIVIEPMSSLGGKGQASVKLPGWEGAYKAGFRCSRGGTWVEGPVHVQQHRGYGWQPSK